MCGFAGYINLREGPEADPGLLVRMAGKLVHRGPDSCGYFAEGGAGLGFRRLSIIDPAGGDQPLYNEDGSVVLVCNGEIYNYRELRERLERRGHSFRTDSDVEALLHLYEEEGAGFLNRLNGQFAFALYDRRERRLLLARDHFGVCPLHFTVAGGALVFASEIKALLEHPAVAREVDLTGLDQVFSFPGLVSPRTLFKGVESLPSGHYLTVERGEVKVAEYWDLDYPRPGEGGAPRPEEDYVEELSELFARSVRYRLQADVPVGFYLSGGLDSSMIGAMIRRVSPEGRRHSFAITFDDAAICEERHQRLLAERVGSIHHDIRFGWAEIAARLPDVIYHCECPVKETYNTCSMALSEAARASGVTVVLTGEGADEMFAGYVGYRFDRFGLRRPDDFDVEAVMEEELRERLWGDPNLFYEIDQYAFRETKAALYSPGVGELFDDFECLNFGPVNKERLRGRHPLHQRSYLDFKLRLSDHLVSDHGDRMALANSVEARYPFLDIDLVEFSKRLPPELKLNGFTEKYILKRAAEGLVPREIIDREKFGFHAPGTPYLLGQNVEWINDLLSPARVRRQGYFNPETVERLRRQYLEPGFRLNLPFESDLLMIVLSFGLFLDLFGLPDFN
ncbi:MAG TPA: asparagine synthase (glutamine-hydrolyzing) [Pyrinomonadaceae bacterium]|nr:asparagine synthase (glutamine-hydrolyzing) [Pyrinomonadaceae bacterium]